eukprot:1200187-Amphidinium_carterae.2
MIPQFFLVLLRQTLGVVVCIGHTGVLPGRWTPSTARAQPSSLERPVQPQGRVKSCNLTHGSQNGIL